MAALMSLTHFNGRPPTIPEETPELTHVPIQPMASPVSASRELGEPGETAVTPEPEGPEETEETGKPEGTEEVSETETEGSPSSRLTEDQQLERWLARDPNEDPEMHALRVRYTQAILAIPDITTGSIIPSEPKPIDVQTAVVIGFMVVKKARYNISYDPVTEQIIAHVNQRLRLELQYAPGRPGYQQAQSHFETLTQP
jgi:hypothetical protein